MPESQGASQGGAIFREGGALKGITLKGAAGQRIDQLVQRLAEDDALGQLLRRDGKMARLSTESDDIKLDWVDGVEKALQHPEWLRAAEQEGQDIVAQGVRHVIWSGMGGSVQTVYTLKRLGYLDGPTLSVHPVDSTDPASLNAVLAAIGAAGGSNLDAVLRQTMMIGVSMGMTSEEPITHLSWFDGLLQERGVPDAGSHVQVMTLPDSYLDQFARLRGSRMVPIQLDAENHTPGRMSAPATRVFLRPVALLLAAARASQAGSATLSSSGGTADGARNAADGGAGQGLGHILQRGQDLYGLSHALSSADRRALTQQDAFVRLAAWLSLRAGEGQVAPKLLVELPPGWEGFAPWLEQLVEESLGKAGEGFLIFYGQSMASYGSDCAVLRIAVEGRPEPPSGPAGLPVLTLRVPSSAAAGLPAAAGLGELTALFLGFKKTVAAFGYLQEIVFAGQPAVEAYKKYARDLREAPQAVALDRGASGETGGTARVTYRSLTLDYSSLLRRQLTDEATLAAATQLLGGDPASAADQFAGILAAARDAGSLRYLDLTWNGEPSESVRSVLATGRDLLANRALGIPAKVRTGPSDYHSTEQGETDGPPELVSLRLVAARHEPVAAGQYNDKFLLAQARGTWQAMEDAGRWIVFVTLPDASDSPEGEQALADLRAFLEHAAALLGIA